MSVDLAAILKILEGVMDLEKQLAAAIAAEKDAKRRAVLIKACQGRDLEKIRDLLYAIK